MTHKYFAFAVGPNGGISGSNFAGPFAAVDEAKAWATKLMSQKVVEVCIVRDVAYGRHPIPTVEFQHVHEEEPKKPLAIAG